MANTDEENLRSQKLRRTIEQRRQKITSEQSTLLTERHWNTGDFMGKCMLKNLECYFFDIIL